MRSLRPVSARAAVALALLIAPIFPSETYSGATIDPAAPADAQAEPEATNPIGALADALGRCRRRLSEGERWKIAGAIFRESERHGYDPYFVLAMIEVESTCSPTAVGYNGGLGLIQIKPTTAREVARDAGLPWNGERSLTSPVVNVQLALRYLAHLEERFHDPYLAMVAYNMGPGRIGKMPRWRAQQAQYVRKILKRYENLLAEAEPDT